MFDFLKKKLPEESTAESQIQSAEPVKSNFFNRLRQGLQKTRHGLTEGIAGLLLGKKAIDVGLLEDIETLLLTADVGITTTQAIISDLTAKVTRKQLADVDALWQTLQQYLENILQPCSLPLVIDSQKKPYVVLMVGVNGVGKTTTIGKMAKQFQNQGKKVMLAAGDTFRAAAVEQLQVWGERNQIPVVAQHQGADSASVIFDALSAAKARDIDVLIADTAGRLHTKDNLMQELQKVKRVLAKLDANAPHEIMLVIDAGNGQNALYQAEQFHQAIQLTGITLTKLDGTAKGGIIFAIADKLKLPIRYIGIGEDINDLRSFNAHEFVSALFAASSEEKAKNAS